MSALPPAHRIELSPAVKAILEADDPKSQFLKHFLRYLEALLAPDPAGLDSVVTSDGRCHELEAIGLPRGREGLKSGFANGRFQALRRAKSPHHQPDHGEMDPGLAHP